MSDQENLTSKMYANDVCVPANNIVDYFADDVKWCFTTDNSGARQPRIGLLKRQAVEVNVETANYDGIEYPKRLTIDVEACGNVLQKNVFFNIVDESEQLAFETTEEALLVKATAEPAKRVPKREVVKPKAQTIVKPARHNK